MYGLGFRHKAAGCQSRAHATKAPTSPTLIPKKNTLQNAKTLKPNPNALNPTWRFRVLLNLIITVLGTHLYKPLKCFHMVFIWATRTDSIYYILLK